MASIADVFFKAVLESNQLYADSKRAGDKAGGILGESMRDRVKKAFSGQEFGKGIVQGLGLAGALGAANLASKGISAVTDVIGDSIRAASDLNEEISKSEVIFGKNAESVQAWAKTMDTAGGQAERAALQAASGFAGLFATVGTGIDESTDRAKELTQLGSDLASFFNTDVQTALDALKSGLSGESEPLRRFNVFLSETAVSAKLAQMGIKKVGGQFTEAQKATARYALIMEQTGSAQGDFARTSDGLANSSRILAAEMENLSAELGQELLPLAKEGVTVLLDLVTTVKTVATAFSDATKAVEDFQFAVLLASQGMTREQFEAIKAAHARAAAAREAADVAIAAYKAEMAQGTLALQNAGAAQDAFTGLADKSKSAASAVRIASGSILSTVNMLRKGLTDDANAAAAALYDPIIAALDLADAQAELRGIKARLREKNLTDDEVKELNRRRQEVGKSLIELNGLILTYGTEAERISKTKAFLASGFWAEAYEGATPDQKDALDQWQIALRLSIDSMESESRIGAQDVVDEFGGGLRVGWRTAQAGAQALVDGGDGPMRAAANDARHYGTSAGAEYAAGLRSQQHAVEQAASKLAGAAGSYLKVSSPAEKGPLSELGGPEGWGERIAKLLSKGLASYLPDLSAAIGGAFTPPSMAFAAPNVGASFASTAGIGSGGGAAKVITNNVRVEGLMKARDPLELVDALRRGQETGLIDNGGDWR